MDIINRLEGELRDCDELLDFTLEETDYDIRIKEKSDIQRQYEEDIREARMNPTHYMSGETLLYPSSGCVAFRRALVEE